MESTIVNLTHNRDHVIGKWVHPSVAYEVPAFTRELDDLLATYRPDHLGIERYQGRGIKGKTGESVNMMIGLVLDRATRSNVQWRLYTAALWKNWVNRVVTPDPTKVAKPKKRKYTSIEQVYRLAKVRGIQPHTADTVCMGLWLFEQVSGVEVTEHELLDAVRRVVVT